MQIIDSYKETKTAKTGIKISIFILFLIISSGVIFAISNQKEEVNKTQDKNIAFIEEVYNITKDNYWEKIKDKELTNFFEKGIEQINSSQIELSSDNLAGLTKYLESFFADMKNVKKDEFSVQLASLVLKSLPPQGRNGLFGKKKKQDLANRVNNIDPNKNLYNTLNVSNKSSSEEISQATEEKKKELEEKEVNAKTDEEKEEIKKQMKEVEYAGEVLSDEEKRSVYDTTGKEPTVFKRRLTDDIVHIFIKKFSPTTLQELNKAVEDIDMENKTPSSLILDLRGNVGGSIDIAPYILGPFVGNETYAYETYQQGEKDVVKTKIGWLEGLVPYKKVIILANEKTQSTGEVFVSTLKKYNVGVFVGKTTRGWGTIERVFEIENQIDDKNEYGIFLVHHITLREDGLPIQGRGVDPIIDIDSENWKEDLLKYFNSPELIEKVEEIWNSDLPVN